MLKPILLLLAALVLVACGATPDTGSDVASTQEAVVTPVTVTMYVRPGTVVHRPPNVWHLVSDPAHPGPVGVIDMANNLPASGTFVASSHHGYLNMMQPAFDAAGAIIDTPGRQTLVTFTYDSAVAGDNKPVMEPPTYAGPTFTLL